MPTETIESNRVTCTTNRDKTLSCFFEKIEGRNTLLRNVENIEVDTPFFLKRDKKELFFSSTPSTHKLSCGVFTRGKKSNINCQNVREKK